MTSLVHLKQLMDKPRFERHHLEERFSVDAQSLAADLRRRIDGEVRFDRGSRALYATDGSNYRQVPIGVVVPRSVDDVIRTVETCREYGAPLLSRGGGTSLAGQSCNVAVIMDFSKYLFHVLEIDTVKKLGRVEPGCVLDRLRHTAEKDHLTFGPDPATHSRCALGGMLGNNSCGSHSHLCSHEGRGYRTSDNTHELEILTYGGVRMKVGPTSAAELEEIIRKGGPRGEIYRKVKDFRDKYASLIREKFPKLSKLPRRVSGYNIDELLPDNNDGGFHLARALVGSESTCITILEATLHLVHSPPHRSLLLLGYPDVFHAGDHVMDILPFKPTACEGVDRLLFEWEKQRGGHEKALELLPEGHGWLYVEFGGETKQEADDAAKRCMEGLKKHPNPPSMKLFDNREQEDMLWEVREGSLGATAWVPGHKDTWEGFEDSSVPPEHVGQYLRKFKKLLDKYDYDTSLYGHLAQGCVHCRIPFDFYTAEGIDTYRHFMDEATDLVLSFGGSLSGEHGDGQSRAQFLPKMYGEEMVRAFAEFKQIWDPHNHMNPHKVVDPYSITDNLRLGPDYNPPQPETFFKYPTDKNAFSRAILRCVGIGACRNHKAIMELDDELKLFKQMGAELQQPEKGCCGMAGAFGYEPGEHYEVSVANANRALVPAVNEAADDEIIVADGFSCREQIEQETSRHALHLSQVLQMAIQEGPHGPSGLPERRFVQRRKHALRRSKVQTIAALASVVGFAAWKMYHNSRTRDSHTGETP